MTSSQYSTSCESRLITFISCYLIFIFCVISRDSSDKIFKFIKSLMILTIFNSLFILFCPSLKSLTCVLLFLQQHAKHGNFIIKKRRILSEKASFILDSLSQFYWESIGNLLFYNKFISFDLTMKSFLTTLMT